jgi:hypothetical protein
MDSISAYVDIITSVLSTLALLIAGFWAWWTFAIKRTGKWNLGLAIQTEAFTYSSDPDIRLLVITIRLKNMGSVRITPGTKGLVLKVTKMDETATCYDPVNYSENGTVIYGPSDMLEKYRHPKKGYKCYEIEPNNEYTEIETIVVKKADLLTVECRFYGKDNVDSITEYSVIRV